METKQICGFDLPLGRKKHQCDNYISKARQWLRSLPLMIITLPPVPLPAVCFGEAVTGGLVILLGASSLQATGTELQVLWSGGQVDTGLGVAQTRPVNK